MLHACSWPCWSVEAHSGPGIRSAISIRLTSIFMPSRISHHATRHERSTCTTRGQPESRRDPLQGARAHIRPQRPERVGYRTPRMSMWKIENVLFFLFIVHASRVMYRLLRCRVRTLRMAVRLRLARIRTPLHSNDAAVGRANDDCM